MHRGYFTVEGKHDAGVEEGRGLAGELVALVACLS